MITHLKFTCTHWPGCLFNEGYPIPPFLQLEESSWNSDAPIPLHLNTNPFNKQIYRVLDDLNILKNLSKGAMVVFALIHVSFVELPK